ncbi:MAG: Uncharacterized protein FD147_311 [Chloroflexi bacterium]|nr:MAG: Uncharacterized protein FD147_311 [Chloroflexota bacterium]
MPIINLSGSFYNEHGFLCNVNFFADTKIENLRQLGCCITMSRNVLVGCFHGSEKLDKPMKESTNNDHLTPFTDLRFQQLIETAFEGIWTLDADFCISYVNQRICEILGYSKAEMIGRELSEFMFAEDLADHTEKREKQKQGQTERFERRLKHKNGSERWTLTSATPVQDHNGNFSGVFSMILDISEQREKERQINASEIQIQEILEVLHVGVIVIDEHGKIIFTNPHVDLMFKCDPQHLIGTPFISHVHPHERDMSQKALHKLINGKLVTTSYESRYLCADGSNFQGFLSGRRTLDADGNFSSLVVVVSDITKEKLANREIVEYKSFLETVLDAIPSYVFVRDQDGRYRLTNKAFSEAMGTTPQDIIGKTNLDLGDPVWIAEHAKKEDLEVMQTGKDWTNPEIEIVFPNGGSRFVQFVKRPVYDSQGKITNVLGVITDLTERRKAEGALRESEKKYRTLFESMQQGVYYQLADGLFIDVNPAALEMLGLTRDEFLSRTNTHPGWTILDEEGNTLPSDLHPSIVVINTGKPIIEKFYGVYNFKRERYVWMVVSAFPQFHEGETRPYQVFVTMHDITAEKLAEKELSKREELYRLISSVVSDYLFSTQFDQENNLNLNWVAGAFETITGYSFAEYKEHGGWRAAVHPDDLEQDDHDLQQLRANQKVITEIRTIKKDGNIAWVRVYSQPIWDEENNRLVGINGGVQDITERKLAEDEIRQSAEDFAALYETASDFSMQRDPYVILRTITDRACSLFGVSNAFVCLYDPEQKDLELRISKQPILPIGTHIKLGEGMAGIVAQTQKPVIIDDYSTWHGRLQQSDVSIFAASLGVPMLYGGQLIGVLGVQEFHPNTHKFNKADAHFLSLFASQAAGAVYSADLFEKIRQNALELEKRVDERTKEIQIKNKELETFAYTVSHDLKAPLRSISGYSTLLLEDHADQLDETAKAYLNNLLFATERMDKLIEDLLTYSHAERREIKKTFIDLNELINKILAEHGPELDQGRFTIEKVILCKALYSDSEAITQALRNVLDNAIKFSSEQPKPVITIRCDSTEDHCLISIKDNGIGFDMKFHDKIFEIFQRLHLSEEYPGTGVGLALVRKAIERIGGKVWAESEIGKGSIFYLEIPL